MPFTSGILIGIGETRAERIEALLALRDLHDRYGHIQEIIIQNFRAKPATKHGHGARAVARRAPVDHRGGAHPVRPGDEHPGAAQPAGRIARQADRRRHQRLGRRVAGDARSRQPGGAVAGARSRWRSTRRRPASSSSSGWPSIPLMRCDAGALDRTEARARRCCSTIDADGLARGETWMAGTAKGTPAVRSPGVAAAPVGDDLRRIVDRAAEGRDLSEAEVVRLFAARGAEFEHVVRSGRCAAAGDARRRGHLRRQPQHQLHQRLLFPLPVLRVLERQDVGEPARAALRARPR